MSRWRLEGEIDKLNHVKYKPGRGLNSGKGLLLFCDIIHSRVMKVPLEHKELTDFMQLPQRYTVQFEKQMKQMAGLEEGGTGEKLRGQEYEKEISHRKPIRGERPT